MQSEKTKAAAADKAGMDEKTARKYMRLGKLPNEVEKEHSWRTREDPFEEVWEEVRKKLEINSGLEAKTLFEDLQRRYPGRFADGQLRTLQRHVKRWRALEGPPKEVFFDQEHHPGKSDRSFYNPRWAIEPPNVVTIEAIAEILPLNFGCSERLRWQLHLPATTPNTAREKRGSLETK
jgi:hypothetical protein